MAYPFPVVEPFLLRPLNDQDDFHNLESSPSAASTSTSSSSSTPSTPSELAFPSSPADLRTHHAANRPSSPRRIFHFDSPLQQHQEAQMAQPRMPSSRALPLPRRQTGPRISRQPSSRPPPEMIDLTISSPVEQRRGSSPSNHARKKRRTAEDVIFLNDDLDDTTDEEEETDDSGPPLPPAVELNPDEKPKKLAGTACIICMEDEPVDLSITPCGHMFCNKCLFGAIKATLASPNKVHGKCPVCRGKVAIKDIVVLEIKKMSKGKERAD